MIDTLHVMKHSIMADNKLFEL